MANSNPPEPHCKAILLCQKTIIEEDTRSVSLIGVFEGFVVGPDLRTARSEAFCQITDAKGKYRLTAEIIDLHDGRILARADGGELEVPDQLVRANVIFPIPQMRFPHPGEYDFVMLANGNEIDRQKFRVAVKQGN